MWQAEKREDKIEQRSEFGTQNVKRGRDLELKNEAIQIPASFSMLKPSV